MIHKKDTKPNRVNCPTKANQIKFRAQRWQSFRSRRRSPFLLVGHGDRRPISADKSLAALQRFNQLQRFQQLVASGKSQTIAARQCGFGRTSAWRWLKRFESGGMAALAPRTDRCGRSSIASRSGLTPGLLRQLERSCMVAGSIVAGFKLFARSPDCPPTLARQIRRAKSIAPSLRRLVELQPVQLTGVQSGNHLLLAHQGGPR